MCQEQRRDIVAEMVDLRGEVVAEAAPVVMVRTEVVVEMVEMEEQYLPLPHHSYLVNQRHGFLL